jgi:hypothetical protein
LIEPIGTDLDDLGLRLQRRCVHANNGENSQKSVTGMEEGVRRQIW